MLTIAYSASALPILSSLPTSGVTSSILSSLGGIIQLPSTALTGALSLDNLGLQNGIVNYFTGYVQTNFNILASLAQILALATGEFRPTESTGLCGLASQLNQVGLITNQVDTLNAALQTIVLTIRTCTQLSNVQLNKVSRPS